MLNKKNVVIALLFILGFPKNMLSMKRNEVFTCVDSFYVPKLQNITRVKLSNGGKYIAFGSETGAVSIYDCINKRPKCFYKHDGSILALTFSPDNKYVFSVSANENFSTEKNFKVYSLENEKILYTKVGRFEPFGLYLNDYYSVISMIDGNGNFEQAKTSSDMQITLCANNARNKKEDIFKNNLLECVKEQQLLDVAISFGCNIDSMDVDTMALDQYVSDNDFNYVNYGKNKYKNSPMTASDYTQSRKMKRKRDDYQDSMELDLFEQKHKRIKKKRKIAGKIWERFALLCKQNFDISKSNITSVDVSAHGKHVAVGYSNGFIGVLDLQTRKPLCSYNCNSYIRYVRFSQNGAYLTSLSKDGSLRVFSMRSKKIIYNCCNKNCIIDFCLSEDTKEIVLLLGNGKCERYKLAPNMFMALELDAQKDRQKYLFKQALLKNKKDNRFIDLCVKCADPDKMDTSDDDEIKALSAEFQLLSTQDGANNAFSVVVDNGNNLQISYDENQDSDYQMESDDEDSDVGFLYKAQKRKIENDYPSYEDDEYKNNPFRQKKRTKIK